MVVNDSEGGEGEGNVDGSSNSDGGNGGGDGEPVEMVSAPRSSS